MARFNELETFKSDSVIRATVEGPHFLAVWRKEEVKGFWSWAEGLPGAGLGVCQGKGIHDTACLAGTKKQEWKREKGGQQDPDDRRTADWVGRT